MFQPGLEIINNISLCFINETTGEITATKGKEDLLRSNWPQRLEDEKEHEALAKYFNTDQSLMTVAVRWQGKTRGAFGFALIFLVLFASRQKEHKIAFNNLSMRMS